MNNNKRPLILISNDDGVTAKGINELAEALRGLGDIMMMAPDGPRSGMSSAFTSEDPVHYSKVREEEGLTVYKCSGTPTDCVKLACHILKPRKPDLVIGGINHGDNSSINSTYSGTMGIVKEGCLKGIPSVAFSICDHSPEADFRPMFPYIKSITESVIENGLPTGVCLNVNAPVAEEYKGVKVCRQTVGSWENEWADCPHPRFSNYFWVTGEYINREPQSEDTDHWAMDHGYIAVTPTTIDVTAYEAMDGLKSILEK